MLGALPDPLAAFPLPAPADVAVLRSLLAHGPMTRAELTERSGVSPGAVTKAVRPLIAAGVLGEGDALETGAGRPVRVLFVRPDTARFAGVKVTDSDVTAALTDFAGAALATERVALAAGGVEEVVAAIADAIAGACKRVRLGPTAIPAMCVAVSGDVDREHGYVRFSPFLGWSGVALAGLVRSAVGIETVIENDVRALTLSESVSRAGLGASPLVVVTIGAGIGCGIVLDGQVLNGAHGVSGELGHVPVGDPSIACYCGGHGCVEAIAADPAIMRSVAAATGAPVSSVADAAALALGGDAAAAAVFAAAGEAIGRALAAVANLVGPARILVSGEGLAHYGLLADHIRSAFAEQAYGTASDCDIVLRPHTFEDWALGAAAVARDAFLVRGSGAAAGA